MTMSRFCQRRGIRFILLLVIFFFIGDADSVATVDLAVEKIYYLGPKHLVKGQRNAAYGIAMNSSGNILVGDFHRGAVITLDKDLNELSRFALKDPHGVDVDHEDNIYAATFKNGRVYKLSPQGTEIRDWDQELRTAQKIRLPVAAGFDEENNVYIAEYSGGIIKASSRGAFILSFDLSAFAEKGVFKPHGLFIEGGRVYIAAREPYQGVHIFDVNGEYIQSWTGIKFPFDPVAVRAYDSRYLLIPNYALSRIEIFDREGNHFGALGRNGDEPGSFLAVMNALVTGGYGYFVEEQGNRVQKIRLQPLTGSGF